jgi:hypothetical protein
MKGNHAVRIWRSFVLAAAGAPRVLDERERDEEQGDETTPVPALTGSRLAWDPYEVWLKRVKEPRDRREPRPSPR